MSEGQRFLTISEFAKFSGFSEKTVRRRISDNQLPHYQPGGPKTKILIPIDALDRGAMRHTEVATHSPKDTADRGSNPNANQQNPRPQLPGPKLPGPKPRWR